MRVYLFVSSCLVFWLYTKLDNRRLYHQILFSSTLQEILRSGLKLSCVSFFQSIDKVELHIKKFFGKFYRELFIWLEAFSFAVNVLSLHPLHSLYVIHVTIVYLLLCKTLPKYWSNLLILWKDALIFLKSLPILMKYFVIQYAPVYMIQYSTKSELR